MGDAKTADAGTRLFATGRIVNSIKPEAAVFHGSAVVVHVRPIWTRPARIDPAVSQPANGGDGQSTLRRTARELDAPPGWLHPAWDT